MKKNKLLVESIYNFLKDQGLNRTQRRKKIKEMNKDIRKSSGKLGK